jgi:hypothetical protein
MVQARQLYALDGFLMISRDLLKFFTADVKQLKPDTADILPIKVDAPQPAKPL